MHFSTNRSKYFKLLYKNTVDFVLKKKTKIYPTNASFSRANLDVHLRNKKKVWLIQKLLLKFILKLLPYKDFENLKLHL